MALSEEQDLLLRLVNRKLRLLLKIEEVLHPKAFEQAVEKLIDEDRSREEAAQFFNSKTPPGF